jgi:hypothetical protein
MGGPLRKIPTFDQRAMAAKVVRAVVGDSIDETALWEMWVGEISKAIAEVAWSNPFVSDEHDMANGDKP